MNDENISPKVAPSVYSIMERMKQMGMTEDDLITLIKRRIGDKKITRTQIQQTLEALRRIEVNFGRANQK